jgi:hypothetical protein
MTVVLNDPATMAELVRFGPVPHDVEAAAHVSHGCSFSRPIRPRNAPFGDSGGKAHRASREADRALVASVKDCERGRGDEPHSERGVDDAGSPWIAKNRRD